MREPCAAPAVLSCPPGRNTMGFNRLPLYNGQVDPTCELHSWGDYGWAVLPIIGYYSSIIPKLTNIAPKWLENTSKQLELKTP